VGECAYCHARSGKRACPALTGVICGPCCGQHRGVRIDCPSDCPYFVEGSSYQRDRRQERGVAKGRDFLAERLGAIGKDDEAFAYALGLEEAIHRFREAHPSLRDRDAAGTLAALKAELGGLAVPDLGPVELRRSMVEEERNLSRHFPSLTRNARRKCLEAIEASIARHAVDEGGGRRYLDFIATYFREVTSADRRLSTGPGDSRETPSGLILP
jgi:hypothetical protein